MRHFQKVALLVGSLGISVAAMPAMAGGCGYGGNPYACNMGTSVQSWGTIPAAPTTVNIMPPMGHLKSVNYTRSPNVSITRLHGMTQVPSLTDFPSAFTGGCMPSSTQYCHSNAGTPINVSLNAAPQMRAPIIAAPYTGSSLSLATATPQYSFTAPLPAPRIVAIGGGYDPSKFTPRVYGDNNITPGIVHAPTSFIDRDPTRAAMALQQASYSNYSATSLSPYAGASVQLGGSTMMGGSFGSASSVAAPSSGTPYTGVDASGGYWEKVSGVTRFGDTIATQVICRRQAPQPKVQVQVQQQRVLRPIIGVPVPVPTPVPYTVDVPVQGCMPAPIAAPAYGAMHGRYGAMALRGSQFAAPYMMRGAHLGGFSQHHAAPKPRVVPVPQPLTSGRWTY